ncbi:hypothetical protein SAMN05660880_03581 [Luteibacter sp. 22Crub2.1]|nr:hypothetical protein SAMN05660880_03581 [Luteibacter sp. 22Crub2.1]
MTKRMRFIVVAFVALAGPAEVQATRVTGADVLARWQRTRIARLGGEQASLAAQDIARQMLSNPGSPYSDLIAQPEFTNDVDWVATVDAFSARGLTAAGALAALQWDLGMTRARPRMDIKVKAGFRDDFVAASAIKADVDADVFWHMLDLTGYRHSTKAAVYAVGMQILRAQAIAVPSDEWIAKAIDPDVFTRVMRAQHMDQLRPYDLEYLSTLVQYRLIHWKAGAESSSGHRSLPVVYRVARTAAAYRDAQGYAGSSPCTRDGTPRASSAGTGGDDDRPLCFAAATDRAVHAWYLAEYTRQSTYVPEHHDDGLSRLARFAGLVLTLVDLAGVLEFVEATVAESLVTSEAIGDAEAEASFARADLLSCPIPE